MASGKTLEMIEFSSGEPSLLRRLTQLQTPRRTEPRDRTLRGKQRRKQRKALQRRPLESPSDW